MPGTIAASHISKILKWVKPLMSTFALECDVELSEIIDRKFIRSSKLWLSHLYANHQLELSRHIVQGQVFDASGALVPLATAGNKTLTLITWSWDEAHQLTSESSTFGICSHLPLTQEYLTLLARGSSTAGVAMSTLVQKGGITVVDLVTREALLPNLVQISNLFSGGAPPTAACSQFACFPWVPTLLHLALIPTPPHPPKFVFFLPHMAIEGVLTRQK